MPNSTEKPRIGNKETLRQRKLASIISENLGIPLGKAMKKAGYSDAYAKSPHQIKKTLGWQELMDKYLPDKLLVRAHKKLFRKKEFVLVGKTRQLKATGELDPFAVSKALELGYKIKSKMKGEEGAPAPVTVNIINYGDPIKPKEGDKPTV